MFEQKKHGRCILLLFLLGAFPLLLLSQNPPAPPGGGGAAPAVDPVTGLPIANTNVPPANTNAPGGGTNAPTVPRLTQADIEEAMRVFQDFVRLTRENAEKGDPLHQHNLGVIYLQGIGRPLDFREAYKWFNKSAQQNYPNAQFNLALCFANGMGTHKSKVEAYRWWSLAASHGFEGAAIARDNMAFYLTREEIAQGQRMSRAFIDDFELKEKYKPRPKLKAPEPAPKYTGSTSNRLRR